MMNKRHLLYRLLSPLNWVFRQFYKDRVRVLAYHTVPDPAAFEMQLQFLKSNYYIIDLHEFKDHLFKGNSLPENSVLITFDDGDISVLEKGLPVLQKFGIPAVLFVITNLIDTQKTFWCRQVEKVLQAKGKSYQEAREQVIHLKSIAEQERIAYLSGLDEVSGRQLTYSELLQLFENQIFIANHSHSHPMFDNCSYTEISRELEKTKSKFREWGIPGFNVFAYPNGNYSTLSEKALNEHNIEMAFLFDHKINKTRINPLRISRIRVDSNLSLTEFQVKVSGVHPKIMNLK